MKAHFRLSLFLAVSFLLISCALASTNKVTRRRSPSLTSEQKSLLLNKSRQAISDKSTSKAIVEITRALARSHSASEVLTLNLTNLLILIVLKAVIFGIGLFYFGGVSFKGGYKGHEHGHGHGHGYGRSLDGKSSPLMTEAEILLMLTYLLGSSSDDYTCFHRVACENPQQAKTYLKVSKMMLKGAKFAQNFVSYNPKYEEVLSGLEGALSQSSSGGSCPAKYPCSDIPHL